MPMVSLKLMAGAARSMVVASARTTAAVCVNQFPRESRGGRMIAPPVYFSFGLVSTIVSSL
jgi:hypothetical protein